MPIYVATINGTPTVVYAAPDHVRALKFVADDFIRSELCDLRAPNGSPLLRPDIEIEVREAAGKEYAVWEAALNDALRNQVYESREDAIEHECFAFLVEYREADE